MTNSGPPLPTDKTATTDHARQNMQALVAELTGRGCEVLLFNKEGRPASQEGSLEFDIEAPDSYGDTLVVPGIPTPSLKSATEEDSWLLRWGHKSYTWTAFVDERSALAQGLRTIHANADLFVAELRRRGLPLNADGVGPDWDAASSTWITYDLPIGDEVVYASFPDQPIGPGLGQVLYVQGEEYTWEAAVMAVFTEAGVPVPGRPPRISSPPDRDRLPAAGPDGRVRSENT
ncbi:hypothetical protein ABWJ92_28700 [Streptomyces sp. NPDC000609]|uniref:hypothetical protein n=1 Tax=Streptomyces sp. NPDC000609 TaxID=3160957 RepID=UPI00339894A7